MLSFLEKRLNRQMSPFTLKMYIWTIVVYHDTVEGRSLGKYNQIVTFLKFMRRLNPFRLCLIPLLGLTGYSESSFLALRIS